MTVHLHCRLLLSARFSTLVLLASVPILAQDATTYYVSTTGSDSNPGTSLSEPWLTLQHAAATATAGATVYVLGGTYRLTSVINFPNSGTATAPIMFENYPGQAPIIDGTRVEASGTEGLINISGARSYITIKGFTLRNFSTTGTSAVPCGINYSGSGTGVQILNNIVHHITTTNENGNAYGITVIGSETTPITELVISGNIVHDNKTGESETVSINGNVTHYLISNNLIHDNNNIGIDTEGYWGFGPVGYDVPMYGIISGNTVYNISGIANPGESDEYDADGIYCDGCAYTTIERNVVFQTDYGIETTSENEECQANGTEWTSPTIGPTGMSNGGTAAESTHPCYGMYCTVRNNLFYHANSCGTSIGGYSQETGEANENGGGSSYRDVFVNNTVYDNGTQAGNSSEGEPSGDWQIQYQVGSAQHNYFENNLVYSGLPNIWINNYAANSGYSPGYSYPPPAATQNWNLWYSASGYVEGTSILWAGVSNYSSFEDYQGIAREDADSLNQDPLLVDVTATPPNLDTTQGSPAIGAGRISLTCSIGWCDPNGSSPNSIYGATDFIGNPRLSANGSIDIGAYQDTGTSMHNTLTVDLRAEPQTIARGEATTLTVKVSAVPGGAGVPSGTVKYMLGSRLLGTQTLFPTGPTTSGASMPISARQLMEGANKITAVYSGNSIAPCCNPSNPPGGTQTPVAVYPRSTSSAVTVTVCR